MNAEIRREEFNRLKSQNFDDSNINTELWPSLNITENLPHELTCRAWASRQEAGSLPLTVSVQQLRSLQRWDV